MRACSTTRPGSDPAPPPACSALLNGDGEEARVVGGAVRNALLEAADRRHRYRDHGVAGRSDPPRQGRRHQERADRHRARHRDAGGRGAAVRGHDVARGHRDLRPQGQGRVRPRLGRAMRSGAISPSTACRSMPTASCTITSAGLPISPPGACASSAIPTQRIAEDYLRILRFFRIHAAYGAGEPDRAGYSRLHRRRARALRRLSRRTRAHGNAEADGRAEARPARSWRWRTADCCCRSSAASPIPGRSPR